MNLKTKYDEKCKLKEIYSIEINELLNENKNLESEELKVLENINIMKNKYIIIASREKQHLYFLKELKENINDHKNHLIPAIELKLQKIHFQTNSLNYLKDIKNFLQSTNTHT